MKISDNPVPSGSGGSGGGGGHSGSHSGGGGGDKSMPKDGRVMMAILKDMNITDYEPRVVEQLLEFTYRYISSVLEDARTLANFAKKKGPPGAAGSSGGGNQAGAGAVQIDVEDVKLAVQMYAEHNLTSPPTRDILLEVASKKNSTQLPLPKATGAELSSFWMLLPRECLWSVEKSGCAPRTSEQPASRPPRRSGRRRLQPGYPLHWNQLLREAPFSWQSWQGSGHPPERMICICR